jgi:hypothetical protein
MADNILSVMAGHDGEDVVGHFLFPWSFAEFVVLSNTRIARF